MKKVLVVGCRKSGVYSALLAKKVGYDVFLTEDKDNEEVRIFLPLLESQGIDYEIGKHSFNHFKDYDLAVLSPGVPLSAEVVKVIKENSIPIVGETEFAFVNASSTTIIAITGSNGKSTTTALTGHIFDVSGQFTVTGGNLGTPFSELLYENPHPQIAVLETSCFQLETVVTYKPKVAVFLNLMENHLDRYSSMEEYLTVKKKIFMNQEIDNFAVLNHDDSIVNGFEPSIKSKPYFFSINEKVDRGAYLKEGKVTFIDGVEESLFDISIIPLRGKHNVTNVLASVVSAKVMGVDMRAIIEGVRTFKGLPHRLEEVRVIDGVLYVNDSKSTTPDSTIKALESFIEPIVLIAGGSSKNNDFLKMAEKFRGKVKKLILIGQTAREIGDASVRVGYGDFIIADSLAEAVLTAKDNAQAGDVVLLSPACASFDMFKDFENRGNAFKNFVNSL